MGNGMKAGLGHNRIAPLNPLLDDARAEVAALQTQLAEAIAGTRAQQMAALSAVYRLYLGLREMPDDGAAFYAEHEIVPNPRAKYAAQPVVRHLTANGDRDLRVRTSFWSGAIAWAMRNEVQADEFEAFIESTEGGIDGAYRLELQARQGKTERGEQARLLADATRSFALAFPPEALPATRWLKNAEAGKHILIVEIDDDGSAKIVARVERSLDDAEKMFDEQVLAWHAKQAEDDG